MRINGIMTTRASVIVLLVPGAAICEVRCKGIEDNAIHPL